ncbi:EamA family transporter [Sphingobium sp. CR28]|uniref:EamA family transporter n=1 Tax=Sphingobium sp. CR28 TaxID=3400272 RepID=UPI003FEDA396
MLWWIPATLLAAAAQVARNGLQANLRSQIGTLGATQVRFVFGLPFACLFWLVAWALLGGPLPHFTAEAWSYALLGALTQIAATALMLVAMAQRAFGVAYAYIKSEPILVALFGVLLLGDQLTLLAWTGIVIATIGILVVSVDPRSWRDLLREGRPMAFGIGAGAFFGLASVALRGAIVSMEGGGFFMRALTVLAVVMAVQTLVLGLYLAPFDRPAFVGSLRIWRQSLTAGFLGALATAGWNVALSLSAAANVRTLGLIEMPVAGFFNRHVSGGTLSTREWMGMVLVISGIALLMTQAL